MVSVARKPRQFPFGRSNVTSPRLSSAGSNVMLKATIGISAAVFLCYACFGSESDFGQALTEARVAEEHMAQAAQALFHNPLLDLANANDNADNANDHQQARSKKYIPAPTERFVIEHANELGYDSQEWTRGCNIWSNSTPSNIQPGLESLVHELQDYNERLHKFVPVKDLRKRLIDGDSVHNAAVCKSVQLHPAGVQAIFPSGELSQTANAGYLEPLLPPMRHPEYCLSGGRQKLLDLGYLVHDFSHMCRSLKRTSRTVLIDMGASLDFHGAGDNIQTMPAVYLMELYKRFGFPFDHIYAFEQTLADPKHVYEKLPHQWLTAYHWINVGVDADPDSRMNPLRWILESFDEDDFVVIKLDIDTPSVEVPLVLQLLNDARYHNLVDQFYFEHHVKLFELARYWGPTGGAVGSIRDSLHLFAGLRAKGIASHFWV